MNSTDLLRQFRLDMDDLEKPYLWSDAEVFEYMTDAQRMFCRLTEGIADSRTTSVCQLTVVSGTEWYALSPLIKKLRSAHRTDTGAPIAIMNPEKLDHFGIRFDGRTSPVKALVVGLTDGFVRTVPVPSETAVTVNLSVFRLPLKALDDTDQKLEIGEEHHVHLMDWMRKRGYSKQDADTIDLKRADDHEAKFRQYCFKALAEQERARRSVGATLYGGI